MLINKGIETTRDSERDSFNGLIAGERCKAVKYVTSRTALRCSVPRWRRVRVEKILKQEAPRAAACPLPVWGRGGGECAGERRERERSFSQPGGYLGDAPQYTHTRTPRTSRET